MKLAEVGIFNVNIAFHTPIVVSRKFNNLKFGLDFRLYISTNYNWAKFYTNSFKGERPHIQSHSMTFFLESLNLNLKFCLVYFEIFPYLQNFRRKCRTFDQFPELASHRIEKLQNALPTL